MDHKKKFITLKTEKTSETPGNSADSPKVSTSDGNSEFGEISAVHVDELSDLTGVLESMSKKLVHLAFLVASMANDEEAVSEHSFQNGVDPFALAHSKTSSKLIN